MLIVFSSQNFGNAAAHDGIGVGTLIAMDSVSAYRRSGTIYQNRAKSAPISAWRDQLARAGDERYTHSDHEHPDAAPHRRCLP
jgi:hypothetical protein